ncbi:hypothetical protein [Arthrobacter methylotrophus]|uniref:hypothetical protein n=1 Tax=Arthrobacter methylotrophus TaxID=121291 RepID=UPI0031EF78A0
MTRLLGRRSTSTADRQVLRDLSDEEQATLAALLRKVSDNAEHALTASTEGPIPRHAAHARRDLLEPEPQAADAASRYQGPSR